MAVPPEKVRLRIGNLAKAVLVTGQAYQDPKDALNEFVSNAADEYVEAGMRRGRIRVVLRRRGQRPHIVIHDDGRGLSPDRLRDVARPRPRRWCGWSSECVATSRSADSPTTPAPLELLCHRRRVR